MWDDKKKKKKKSDSFVTFLWNGFLRNVASETKRGDATRCSAPCRLIIEYEEKKIWK